LVGRRLGRRTGCEHEHGRRTKKLKAGLRAVVLYEEMEENLDLRCRPAGGDIKPPRGALANDCRAERRGKRRGFDRVRCGSGR
jgi:hypothetical protein